MPSRPTDYPGSPGGLAESIEAARAGAISRLDELERYREDSILVWRLHKALLRRPEVRVVFEQAHRSSPDPTATDRVLDRLAEAADRADGYLLDELPSFTVQRLAGIQEEFLTGVVRAWLLAHPQSLIQGDREREAPADAGRRERPGRQRTIDFRRVVRETRGAIIADVAGGVVRRLARQSLEEQYSRLAALTKAAACRPDGEDLAALAELALTRNALVHAGGVAGEEYIGKAGERGRARVGERLPLPDRYLENSLALVRRTITRAAEAAALKAGAAPARG